MRASVLAFAQKQRQKQRLMGALAEISPSPFPLIAAVLNDSHVSSALSADGSVILDMGFGDGRWLFAALEQFHGGRLCAVGVELDPERIALTRRAMTEEGVLKLEIIQADFLHVDVSAATVLIAYLSRDGNRAIASKLSQELGAGALVVAVGFQFIWAKKLLSTYNVGGLPAYIYEM